MSSQSEPKTSQECTNDIDSSPIHSAHPSSDASTLGFYAATNHFSDLTTPAQSSSPATSLLASSQECRETIKKSPEGSAPTRNQTLETIGSPVSGENMDNDLQHTSTLPIRHAVVSPLKVVKRPSKGRSPALLSKKGKENTIPAHIVTKTLLRRRHTDLSFPPLKKVKHTPSSSNNIHRRASLRKADSLRAEAELLPPADWKELLAPLASKIKSEEHEAHQPLTKEEEESLVKTVQVTARPPPARRLKTAPQPCKPTLIPITTAVAPPLPTLTRIPLLPLSEASQAKLRLRRLKERETSLREREQLTPQAILAIEALKENDTHKDSSVPSQSSQKSDSSWSMNETVLRYTRKAAWSDTLGVASDLFARIIRWILKNARDSAPFHKFDLIEHLKVSPETRFHAAYLALRYFYSVASEHRAAGLVPPFMEGDSQGECNELAAWDIAAGCFALSVKFHRDTLRPLYPIAADDFIALAPHDLDFEDLETAQVDVLTAISYRLGDSPQIILSELWDAVPALRSLLDFPSGWGVVQRETWWLLFDAVADPSVLRFPLTVLTGSALCEALIRTLKNKYDFEGTCPGDWRKDAVRGRGAYVRSAGARVRLAIEEADDAILDLQDALMISDRDLFDCRQWLVSPGHSSVSGDAPF